MITRPGSTTILATVQELLAELTAMGPRGWGDVDGGNASSVYSPKQTINGGSA